MDIVTLAYIILLFYSTEKYKKRESYESKYSAEEKVVEEELSDDEDFQRSVSERRQEIQKRLTRTIPASTQRVEIVEEITNIKRQSLVEDKIAEVEQKTVQDPKTISKTVTTTTTTTMLPSDKKTVSETVEVQKTTLPSDIPQLSETERIITTTTTKEIIQDKPESKTTVTTVITRTNDVDDITHKITDIERDTQLFESVSQKLETDKRTVPRLIAQESGRFL